MPKNNLIIAEIIIQKILKKFWSRSILDSEIKTELFQRNLLIKMGRNNIMNNFIIKNDLKIIRVAEQIAEIKAWKNMIDADIDYSDILKIFTLQCAEIFCKISIKKFKIILGRVGKV